MANRQTNNKDLGLLTVKLVTAVLVILSTVSYASQWYAQNISMPRYCANTEDYLQRVANIIEDREIPENDSRRNYLVAAKLSYLSPRYPEETAETYLQRLKTQLETTCG